MNMMYIGYWLVNSSKSVTIYSEHLIMFIENYIIIICIVHFKSHVYYSLLIKITMKNQNRFCQKLVLH